ncbi:hypothetical protein GCM10018777_33360 [Streptomyces albogriseolus]|nr:hypothetical protein GCM10018777_33360 [Streptomyces viridodiastaticus]
MVGVGVRRGGLRPGVVVRAPAEAYAAPEGVGQTGRAGHNHQGEDGGTRRPRLGLVLSHAAQYTPRSGELYPGP